MAVATRIEFDRTKKQLVLENYASEPVRLNEITINKVAVVLAGAPQFGSAIQ